MWKDDRLRWKSGNSNTSSGDVETPVKHSSSKPRGAASTGTSAAARALGVVPLRVWLIIAYLSVLHIAVMVSFTRGNDLSKLCGDRAMAGGDLALP
jgi:hypothetical protein